MLRRALRLQARRGFSIVEMIISLSVGSIVAAAIFGTIAIMQRQYRTQRETRTVEDGMRVAEQMLRTVLQGAGADPRSIGVTALDPLTLTAGKGNQIRVRSDFNPANAAVTDTLEDVSVRVVADTLQVRWIAGGLFQALAYPVRSISFEYFDQAFTPLTTTATAANAIAVRFTINAPENPKSSIVRSRQTWVYLQNRR
jgi:prepilin-type N-terminal cleavage/methylation domain-containing protein